MTRHLSIGHCPLRHWPYLTTLRMRTWSYNTWISIVRSQQRQEHSNAIDIFSQGTF